MNYIYEYIKNHSINITNEKIQNISGSDDTIQYIIDFELQKVNFDSNVFDNYFNEDNCTEIYLNHTPLEDSYTVTEIIEDLDEEDLLSIKIIRNYNIFSDKILLYSSKSILKFIENFVKSKISYIADIQKKIVLVPYIINTKHSFDSSIFEIERFEDSVSTSVSNIDTYTKKFIDKFKKTKAPIILIPNIISEDIFKDFALFPVITSILEILANEKNGNDYKFKSTFTFKITAKDNINYSKQEKYEHFILLKEIFEYIFINTSTSDQKLTFFRKAFCENIKKDTEIQLNELSPEQLKEIYLDTKFLFDTFEDGEVSAFLKEKKNALKEYLNMAKNISKYIDALQEEMIKSSLAILGLVITHSLFRVRLNMSTGQNITIILCILLFLVISLLLFSYKTHTKQKSINLNLTMLNKHFSFLSSKSDEIKEDMNKLIQNNIKTLNTFISISNGVYFVLLIFVMVFLTFFVIKLI